MRQANNDFSKDVEMRLSSVLHHQSDNFYGKPFYYLLSKIDILYIISDILYRI